MNIILLAVFAFCFTFSLLNIIISKAYITSAVDALAAVLSIITLFYFHKTDNIRVSTLAAVLLLLCTLSLYLFISESSHYSLFWICVFPPVVYFLLGIKRGRIVTLIYSGLLLAFLLYNLKNWERSGFALDSIFNIAGATLGLILLISYFELSRKEVALVLKQKNIELEENKDHLRLILDSTAEAIFGIDTEGNCTFCNSSCLRILGCTSQDELLGSNIHSKVHHSRKDGSPLPLEECKMFNVFTEGKGTHAENEVFWRADGTSFDTEYASYPQYKDGKIIGCVISFKDVTERKKADERIKYLSCCDALTGLYNRSYLIEELARLNTDKNLPLSIIFGDVNGLKMTNDIFGHAAGDELLKKSADILRRASRDGDIVARVGGDEFIILLPKTGSEETERIISGIKEEFSAAQISAIKCSISIGYDTKTNANQDIKRTMENAENEMYKEKTLNRKAINSNIINTIINTLHERCPRERQHSINVSELCEKIGRAMNLSEPVVKKLKDAGFLHDIGKIVLEENILKKDIPLTVQEKKELQQHSIVGYRILNLFDNTLDLAEGIYGHHEAWNGSGYPKGLKGKEIPKLSRIITVAEAYDAFINNITKKEISKEVALQKVKELSGIKLDPEITDIFIDIMTEKQAVTN